MTPEADWRTEFLRLFSSGNRADVAAAFDLKLRCAPTRFFKFFPPSDHAFDGLANDVLWLASPYTFNDPFDSGLTIDGESLMGVAASRTHASESSDLAKLGISAQELAALTAGRKDDAVVAKPAAVAPDDERGDVLELARVLPAIVGAMTEKIIKSMETGFQYGLKIACFTEHATSLLLWAHYAAAHRGFCVEYDFGDNPAHPAQRRLLFPVFYGPDRFDCTPSLRAFAAGTYEVPNHAILAALHKAPEWAYEREWRIVHPDGNPGPGLAIRGPKPRGVYCGVRMSDADRARLAKICTGKSVPLRSVTLSREKYEVVLMDSALEEPPLTSLPQ